MEKLSRVKKYEDLRKSIETDNNIDNASQLRNTEQEETLKKFDSSIFKRVDIQDDVHTPIREKKLAGMDEKPPVDDTFTNEYLDDFMKEVREYNIRKGTRESDNTQADILYQLNAANRAKRSRYIQEIQEEDAASKKTVLSRDDIAMQVQNLLKEEEDVKPYTNTPIDPFGFNLTSAHDEEQVSFQHPKKPTVHSVHHDQQPAEKKQEEPYHFPIEDLDMDIDPKPQHGRETNVYPSSKEESNIQEHAVFQEPDVSNDAQKDSMRHHQSVIEEPDSSYPQHAAHAFHEEKEPMAEKEVQEAEEDKEKQPGGLHNKLLEETQQLRVQMGEYEDELTDLSDGMEKTNKLLNFVLCFLILVLLVIIGFIGYSLWKAGGI